jgi:hypothetical protein
MKRIAILLCLLLAGMALLAEEPAPLFSMAGVTDGYILAGVDGGTLTAGQDINIDVGPVFVDLTGDWTKTLYGGTDVLALTYTLGFAKTFGIFSPSLKLTGDRSYEFQGKAWTGDLFSDLEPQLGIAYKSVGLDLYSDLSFEKDYDFLQTFDGSAYLKFKAGNLRAGILYMTDVAIVDDIGYPFAPASRAGVSFYAKASISY